LAVGRWAFAKRAARRSIGAKGVAKFGHAAAQFVVSTTKLFVALELISSKAEARQHREEEEAVPELQLPANGFEYHGQPSMQ
jgi:hypothetical protein